MFLLSPSLALGTSGLAASVNFNQSIVHNYFISRLFKNASFLSSEYIRLKVFDELELPSNCDSLQKLMRFSPWCRLLFLACDQVRVTWQLLVMTALHTAQAYMNCPRSRMS